MNKLGRRLAHAAVLAAVIWSYDIWSGVFMLSFALKMNV